MLRASVRRRVWSLFIGDKPMGFSNLAVLDIDDISPQRFST
ncbi:MAG: hypothetical protein M5R42_20020 [Rhodocyclaceae bacterium]|jgi:hypothetical protein|nr:hypothetical protein [Rhodocyclaceae bacterium]